MALQINLPSLFQHLIWLPIRLFMLIFFSASISGINNVKMTKGNVIFASSHTTELDPLYIVASLPFFSDKLPIIYVVMGKQYYEDIYKDRWKGWRKATYGGLFFRIIGGYEAYRGLKDYNMALKNHLDAIKRRRTVCIFPVGKFHNKNDYSQAKGGASFLAKKTGLPIIPILIEWSGRNNNKDNRSSKRRRLKIVFGEPLYAKDIFDNASIRTTKDGKNQYEKASIVLMQQIAKLS